MLPSHYTKFVDGAGIGKINKEKRNKFFNSYENHIQTEYHKSTTTALLEESASYYDDKFGEIDMLTDARHGWRKNAKDASIVAIGEKTHKVLSCQHVTKADEVVSQRHERIGTVRFRQAKQTSTETIDSFHTRLVSLQNAEPFPSLHINKGYFSLNSVRFDQDQPMEDPGDWITNQKEKLATEIGI
ncbi:unnamed protein product [Mytilus coruscus]|uniref:Uncharacterized protein n=1 Tax=Mytilus coruscus TaxID=42192 RepID=A0A6J8BJW3_MYTCO|nr:unnamed protein product [Mytilus coruscus]